jgi:hypothetical protein
MPDILAALAAAGVPRSKIVVAWDFTTASDEYLTGHVRSMRDQALAMAGPTGIGYTITSVDEHFQPKVLRRIRGTFTVPSFLTNTDESKAESHLVLDSTGKPMLQGTYEAPFTIIVPAIAETQGPLPLLLYGHGLFNTGENELSDPTAYVQDFAQSAGYVVFATDWIGLSSHEDPAHPNSNEALALVLTDFDKLPYITDRLQQSLVSTMVLERTMVGRIVLDPAMTVTGKAGGAPVADASRIAYHGNSLGGIMGMSFMAYDPDVMRGALGVGGGFFSVLLQRAIFWLEARVVIKSAYSDPLDVQLLLALAQAQFDFSEPATVAPYVLSGPIEGAPSKQLLMQMGVGDAQVANIGSEMIARTAGAPLLSPSVVDIWGLPQPSGPLASALTTWDVHGTPIPPDTNQTPSSDNAVHEAIRRRPQAQAQIQRFFATGQIVDTCGGPCSF